MTAHFLRRFLILAFSLQRRLLRTPPICSKLLLNDLRNYHSLTPNRCSLCCFPCWGRICWLCTDPGTPCHHRPGKSDIRQWEIRGSLWGSCLEGLQFCKVTSIDFLNTLLYTLYILFKWNNYFIYKMIVICNGIEFN